MAANFEIPSSDDFFGGSNHVGYSQSTEKSDSYNHNSNDNQSIRLSFNIKRGGKLSSKNDYQYFDTKLIERAISLLNDYKKIYQFAVVNC